MRFSFCLSRAVHMVRVQLQFFIATNELHEIQFKCPHDAITTAKLNYMQHFNCKKQMAVAIVPCEQTFRTLSRSV